MFLFSISFQTFLLNSTRNVYFEWKIQRSWNGICFLSGKCLNKNDLKVN